MKERKGVRLLHNARILSTVSGEMQHPDTVLWRRVEDHSPLFVLRFCLEKGLVTSIFPMCLSSSLAFITSSQLPAGSGRRLDQPPPGGGGDGPRPFPGSVQRLPQRTAPSLFYCLLHPAWDDPQAQYELQEDSRVFHTVLFSARRGT